MNTRVLNCAILCVLLTGVCAAGASQSKLEQQCGIDEHQPAQRVFAKVDDQQPWREYQTLKAVPELALGFGTSAEMWKSEKQTLLIRTDEPGEDFEGYTEYCFDKSGQLVGLAYELRTAWGWGFRMSGPVKDGAVRDESTEFFDTKTGRAISRPQGADDAPEALKPSLFRRASQLPFYYLLSR
jgi:hypothetical protein